MSGGGRRNLVAIAHTEGEVGQASRGGITLTAWEQVPQSSMPYKRVKVPGYEALRFVAGPMLVMWSVH